MKRAIVLVILALGLSACDNGEPAGGRGYFDPPPQTRYPYSAVSPVSPVNPNGEAVARAPQPGFAADAGAQPAQTGDPGAPRTAIAADDPNAELANEVTAALGLDTGIDPDMDTGIDPNADSINLSLDSQEVQARERAAAQARRDAARDQLVVIEPEPVPQTDLNANVVKFARETTHPVGTRRYNRPAFRDRLQSASVCRRFDTPDEAQRRFLANGGPETDRFNLDPDGDGFACKFDPEKYRRLQF